MSARLRVLQLRVSLAPFLSIASLCRVVALKQAGMTQSNRWQARIFDPRVKRYKVTLRGETCQAQGCRFSVSGQRAPVYDIVIDRETSKKDIGGEEKEKAEAEKDERCDGCEGRCKRNEARLETFRDPFTRLGYARILLSKEHNDAQGSALIKLRTFRLTFQKRVAAAAAAAESSWKTFDRKDTESYYVYCQRIERNRSTLSSFIGAPKGENIWSVDRQRGSWRADIGARELQIPEWHAEKSSPSKLNESRERIEMLAMLFSVSNNAAE
ncbi:hypothetical protein M0804_000584 [Polistes exclamans]|nr:hypothetical protein M0804_000584 [Polistes exclamans]